MLLLGELIVLGISTSAPGTAAPGISLVAAAAFVAAGLRGVRRSASEPRWVRARRGATAALGAYGLTVPLALVGGFAEVNVPQVLFTSVIAVVVGGIAGQARAGTAASPDGPVP